MKAIPVATVLAAGLIAAAGAQEKKVPDAKTTAYQGSISEEQLRSETRRVKDTIAALKQEFSGYSTVRAELSKLEEAANDLSQLEIHDMREAAQVMRDASRMEDSENVKARLLQASETQKKIQTELRQIADRLAIQKDLAALQQRFEQLALRQAANLRETRQAFPDPQQQQQQQSPQEQPTPREQAMVQTEQKAIAAEVKAAVEKLRELSTPEMAEKTKAFQEALAQAEQNQLSPKAEEAAQKTAEQNPEAANTEKAVSEGLKDVIAALDKEKSEEDRARELADKLDRLSDQQKALTAETVQAQSYNQDSIRRKEAKIADKVDLAKDALDRLDPQAAQQAEAARENAEKVVDQLNQPEKFDDANEVAKATDRQQEAAKQLDAASEMLKKKAEELAKNNPQSNRPNSPNSPQDPSDQQQDGQDQQASAEEQAAEEAAAEMAEKMDDLAQKLKDAKLQMQVADRQMQQGNDLKDAANRLKEAGEQLQEAKQMAGEMAPMLPAEIGQHIEKAGEHDSQAQQNLEKGGQDPNNLMQAVGQSNEGQEEINRALAGIKAAAMQMGQMAGQMAGQKPGGQKGGKQPGQQPGQQQGQQAGPSNQPGNGHSPGELAASHNTDANVIQPGKVETGQREALMLLQQEKAAPGYEEMVQQYIRNLAKGELPSR